MSKHTVFIILQFVSVVFTTVELKDTILIFLPVVTKKCKGYPEDGVGGGVMHPWITLLEGQQRIGWVLFLDQKIVICHKYKSQDEK